MDCRKKKQDGEQTLYDDLQSSNDVARERAYLLAIIKKDSRNEISNPFLRDHY